MAPRKRDGFTLIELMIVIIIVGVLAAVAIPLYQGIPARSRATEAASALGLVRSTMRNYYAEHGTFVNANFTDEAGVTTASILGVTDFDLLGKYFSSECYTFDGAPTANTYTIECDGSKSTAPGAADVSDLVMTIDQMGEVTDNW